MYTLYANGAYFELKKKGMCLRFLKKKKSVLKLLDRTVYTSHSNFLHFSLIAAREKRGSIQFEERNKTVYYLKIKFLPDRQHSPPRYKEQVVNSV